MGTIVEANCAQCNYTAKLFEGFGFAFIEERIAFCRACGIVTTATVGEKKDRQWRNVGTGNCRRCKKSLEFYLKSTVRQPSESYFCPRCQQSRLTFHNVGDWD